VPIVVFGRVGRVGPVPTRGTVALRPERARGQQGDIGQLQQRGSSGGQLGSGGSSGSGGNGPQPPGAGNRPTQKEPFRATIFRRRGLGYIPPLLERLRGAFLCVRAPSGARAESMSDYPQHVSDPVDVVRTVWSAARGEGRSHWLPCSGAHIGAQNLGAFS
jgi:hypothetical protein